MVFRAGVLLILTIGVLWASQPNAAGSPRRCERFHDAPVEGVAAPCAKAGPSPSEASPSPVAGSEPEEYELPAEEEPGDGKSPLDPVQSGSCALLVSLLDADSGAPLEGEIDLYRLGAPGNEDWMQGDQLQATVTVESGGTAIPYLPESMYRIFCRTQRHGSEDPPAFEVKGASTQQILQIHAPRRLEVWLRVLDETGRMATEGSYRSYQSNSTRIGATPPWLLARKPRHGETQVLLGCGGGMCCCWRDATRAIATDLRGFSLGEHREDDNVSGLDVGQFWEFGERSEVYVSVRDVAPDACGYVAVVVPMRWVEDLVFLPDGRRAIDLGAAISARCNAVREGDGRTLPVEVSVSLDGYEDLEMTFTLADPMQPQVLVPSEPEPEQEEGGEEEP